MKFNSLHQNSLRAGALGTITDQKVEPLTRREFLNERISVLFLAPEQLANESTQCYLRQRKISLIIVEEAHCAVWGSETFRPEYLVASQVSKMCHPSRVLAISSAEHSAQPLDVFSDGKFHVADPPEIPDKISVHFQLETQENLLERIAAMIKQNEASVGTTIVLVSSAFVSVDDVFQSLWARFGRVVAL